MTTFELLVLAFISLALYGLISWRRQKRHELPLPPGPQGIYLLGNVHDLPPPGQPEFRHWLKFKDIYGPLSSITVLGQTMIIIHDKEVAFELMDRRAINHSGRSRMKFAFDMCGWGNIMVGRQYDRTFRLLRKYTHQQLGSRVAVSRFSALQEAAVGRLLWRLKRDKGKNLALHLKTEAAEIMLKMLYGYSIKTDSPDPLVSDIDKADEQFSQAAVPGKWLVDAVPLLEHVPQWMPGAGFKRFAKLCNETITGVATKPYDFVKKQMHSADHPVSFVSRSIEQAEAEARDHQGPDSDAEYAIKWSAASMYTGGVVTTISAMSPFFLAMSLYPDVQRKAQGEIDAVLGESHRLPLFSDREQLPYVNAIVEEAQRWHPVAPMGLPHAVDQEDTIKGYRIPEGALLIPAVWWWTRDPAVYHDPEVFKPERFLPPCNEPYATNVTFGFGRRRCPGTILADASMFLTFAQALSVFDIQKAVDLETGGEVEPEHSFLPGIIGEATPFSVRVKPRSERHAHLIDAVLEKWPLEQSDAAAFEGH